jgi:phi13 family phage major tail protein
MKDTQKVRIGVKNLYFALLNSDTPSGLAYESPYKVPGLIKIDTNPGTNVDTLYADNKPAIVYATVGTVEVTIEKDSLPDDLLAEILGRPTEGAVNYITGNNNAPYVAVMFQQTYSDGTSSFVKLFKGKFTEPDNSNETKNDSVNFQTGTITGSFVATNIEKDFGSGRIEPIIMATADESSNDYANEGTTWFDYVYQAEPALTITPSVADTDISIATDAVVTLTASNELISSLALNSTRVFILEDGVGVHETTLTIDADKKIVTITPDIALTATTSYTVVYNLTDVYGQETGSTVINFTTA